MNIRNLALGSVASISLLAGGALAADLPVRSAAPAPVMPAPIFSWTGFYVGGSIGWSQHKNSYSDLNGWYSFGCDVCDYSSKSNGVHLGLQAGYNWQFNSLVFGLETDMAYNTGSGTAVVDSDEPAYIRTKAQWMGSFRARLGFAVDRALIYVTGGLAYGNPESTWYEASMDAGFSRDGWRAGWVLGGGVEYAFSNNWSARIEGLYYDLGSKTVGNALNSGDGYFMRVNNEQIVVRVGLNYRFGAPAAPVVARY